MSDLDRTTRPESTLFTFLDVAGWITLLGALLYTAGWAYAYHYFNAFHVGLLALEIPKEYYFVYSFWVLKHQWPWVLGAGIPIWVGLLGIRAVDPRAQPWRYRAQWVLRIMFPALALLLFWGSYQAGRQTGMAHFSLQKHGDYPDYPRVAVQLKEDATREKPVSRTRPAFADGCYRLLLQNRDKLFLFYSFPEALAAELPIAVIAGGEAALVTILPHYNSCGGPP